MGQLCCVPKTMRTSVAPEPVIAKATPQDVVNEQIEEEIRQRQEEADSEIKLLLLGAAESGKSTIFKQMRLLHINTKESEFDKYIQIIYGNVVTSMGNMLQAMRNLSITFENPARKVDMGIIFDVIEHNEEFEPLSIEVARAVDNLWKDGGVKQCYERRNEFQLNDSAKHFFDSVDRIITPFYRPTTQDVLYARAQTKGIKEMTFNIKDTILKYIIYYFTGSDRIDITMPQVIDVGGQRSERRKWIHCFDCVKGIIFVAAINEFNQIMREASDTNRLLDSIGLFEYVCTNEFLRDSAIILFINKIDLFQEKIEAGFSIRETFPDYKGKDNYTESCNYIKDKFLYASRANESKRQIYVNETCAVDCDQVHKVLLSCEDIILENNLREVYIV